MGIFILMALKSFFGGVIIDIVGMEESGFQVGDAFGRRPRSRIQEIARTELQFEPLEIGAELASEELTHRRHKPARAGREEEANSIWLRAPPNQHLRPALGAGTVALVGCAAALRQ